MTLTAAWTLWLVFGMTFIISTRNPLYLLLTTGLLYGLGILLARTKQIKQWLKLNLRFLLTMIIFSGTINMLFVHTGQTVLFKLPQDWPLIGGSFTLESFVYGSINGLVINALYTLFNIFNQALRVKQITRLIPRAFHPIATMVTISLTFFPSIQQRIREIREAQLIRGNPMKKIADWLPVLIPLLVSSLEDAFLLSESMTARGFHTRSEAKSSPLNLILLILSVFAVFAGWIFSLYDYPKLLSIILYGVAAVIIVAIIASSGRNHPSQSYKRETWSAVDKFVVIVLSLGLVTAFAMLTLGDTSSFAYSTYPRLTVPGVHPIGLILALLLGLPLLAINHD